MKDLTLIEAIERAHNEKTDEAIITAFDAINAAAQRHEQVWVNIKVPATWLEYRVERKLDMLLFDPESKTTWFPAYTEKQATRESIISVPAHLDEILVYVSDQDALSGVVLDPFSNCIRIPKEIVCNLADEAENSIGN